MRFARRGAGLLALLVTTLGAMVTVAPGAEAAGRCTPGTGVTVVVDYGSLDRSSAIGCAPNGGGQAASQSVPAAGFTLTYASGQPFVCRIDGLPDATQEPCNRTPPADAYWGLFWNDGKGGGWVYSSQGAASLRVPAGGSIGWRWQDGGGRDLPGAAPNPPAPASSPTKPPKDDGGKPHASSSPTPTPAPTPTTPAPSATAAAAPSASSSPQAAAGAKKRSAGTEKGKKADSKPKAEKAKKKAKAKPSETSSPTPSQTVDGGEQVTATQPTAATPSGDDGTDKVVLLAGVGAVLLLGAAAGVLAWRRRV